MSEKDADINKLGENIEVSKDALGRAIGLPNLMLEYFYNKKFKPDGKRARSQGKSSQVGLWELKPKFRNLNDKQLTKVAKQLQKDLGVGLKKIPRSGKVLSGQFVKGAAVIVSQQASLSAAQRIKEAQLAKIADKVKEKERVKKLKQEIADITAAQSKLAFSTRWAQKLLDNPNLELETKGIGELLNAHELEIDNLTTKTGVDNYIKGINKHVLPLGPLEFFFGKRGSVFIPSSRIAFPDKTAIKNKLTGKVNKKGEVVIKKETDLKKREILKRRLDKGNKHAAYYKKEILKLRKSKNFGESITGVEDFKRPAYKSAFGNSPSEIAAKNKNGSIDKFNKKHGKIHKVIWGRIYDTIKNDKNAAVPIGNFLRLVSQDTRHFHRLGAEMVGWSTKPKGNGKKLYEWEHAMPATAAYLYLMDIALNKGNFKDAYSAVMDNFKLIALDAGMDVKLKKAGLQTKMPKNWNFLDNMWFDRYFNELVASIDGGINPKSIKLTNGKTLSQELNINAEGKPAPLKVGIKQSKTLSTAVMLSRSVNNKTQGITVLDFDDTLATTKSGVLYTLPNPDGTPQPGRKVIFLAGGAGSGKSNVVKQLGLEEQGFKVVNSDISLEWLKKNHGLPASMKDLTKEQASQLGKLQWEARQIAAKKQMKFQGNGDGVIVDGTGGSLKVMQKQVQEFRDKGYDVQMIFVETSLETALERNAARKERTLKEIIVRKNHESVQANKDGFKELFGGNFAEVKTDNLKQTDAMPANLTKKLDKFTRGYIKGRLIAGEYATKGAELQAQGATFDFSEFNKVIEGETAPLFQKALKLADKFTTKDMFVLTARPAESQQAIYDFLKAQGLEIPLANITGLADGKAEAKALWIADKVGEGYNDFYFADDILENVKAVDNMLEQFDVKRKVQQAKVKFSKSMNDNFNDILENITGIESEEKILRY